jgi:hypothetical protein
VVANLKGGGIFDVCPVWQWVWWPFGQHVGHVDPESIHSSVAPEGKNPRMAVGNFRS